jgi:hypothetical protein
VQNVLSLVRGDRTIKQTLPTLLCAQPTNHQITNKAQASTQPCTSNPPFWQLLPTSSHLLLQSLPQLRTRFWRRLVTVLLARTLAIRTVLQFLYATLARTGRTPRFAAASAVAKMQTGRELHIAIAKGTPFVHHLITLQNRPSKNSKIRSAARGQR